MLLRPMTVLLILRAGLAMRFRTSAVSVRRVSVKLSLPPLSDFSIVGSLMPRCICCDLKAHRAPFVLEYDRAAALRDIADDIVKARAQLRLRAVHRTVEQPLSGYRNSRAQKLGKRPQNIL